MGTSEALGLPNIEPDPSTDDLSFHAGLSAAGAETNRSALPADMTASRTTGRIANHARIWLGGCVVDLRENSETVDFIAARGRERGGAPLAVASVNLDHIHHFGAGSRWGGTLESAGKTVEWLNIIDGAPLAQQAHRLTGHPWPRLAGSDLMEPLLDAAERDGTTIGFLGGSAATHERLRERLGSERPGLRVSGYWAPSRESLADPETSLSIAAEVAAAGTDMLVVGLGKPRQELWIAQYGAATGASVLLAFGAVVDFLAGTVDRAPSWLAQHGMEWAWRLAKEPQRLSRRYLVQGPPAMVRLRMWDVSSPVDGLVLNELSSPMAPEREGVFVGPEGHADVTVLCVARNADGALDTLLADLRANAIGIRVRVVVVNVASIDDTGDILRSNPDVVTVMPPEAMGYAAALNLATENAGDADALFIVKAGVRVAPGCLSTLYNRVRLPGVGAVVPLVIDEDGSASPILRQKPKTPQKIVSWMVGDARDALPPWLSAVERSPESYLYPHPVPRVGDTPILVRSSVADRIGRVDEATRRFAQAIRYSDLVNTTGAPVWFEPRAKVTMAARKSSRRPSAEREPADPARRPGHR